MNPYQKVKKDFDDWKEKYDMQKTKRTRRINWWIVLVHILSFILGFMVGGLIF